MSKVNSNSTVTVHYTGRLEDGSVFDTSLSEDREPIKATLGKGELIPGFESGLIDMVAGDKKTIEISHTDAYGDVNPDLFIEVQKTQVPEGVEAGSTLQTVGPQGPALVTVSEIKEDTVIINANHPLAGKKLIFYLELIEVE